MKKDKMIYWLLTGAISSFMFFAAWYAEAHKIEFTKRIGFPVYFRIELTIAKIIGGVVLLFPQVPVRIKEWVYVGFSICLISAFIAKINTGYPFMALLEPVFTFGLMLVAIYYLGRLRNVNDKSV